MLSKRKQEHYLHEASGMCSSFYTALERGSQIRRDFERMIAYVLFAAQAEQKVYRYMLGPSMGQKWFAMLTLADFCQKADVMSKWSKFPGPVAATMVRHIDYQRHLEHNRELKERGKEPLPRTTADSVIRYVKSL